MHTYRIIIFFVLLLLSPQLMSAQTTLKGKAVKIVDGDTFDLLVDGKQLFRVRLQDIDCPERGQDYYKVCKQALADYLFEQEIKVIYSKKDRNGRIIGTVYNRNALVNMIMVQEGYAWHFKKYSNDVRFAYAEIQARKAKRGLWSMPKPIAPWDYRKKIREK